MSGGLKDLLGLPKVGQKATSVQGVDFGKKFRLSMAGLNRNMQLATAEANPADQQPVNNQRLQLFEAFQVASGQIDPADASKAEPAIQRVVAAVLTVNSKATALTSNVTVGRDEWLKREADFDDVMRQIGELEDAGHPKADAFRKLGDGIRGKVKAKKFQESTVAFDQLRPKLDQAVAGNQQTPNVADAGTSADAPGIGVPTPLGPVDIPLDIPVEILKSAFGPRTCNCELVNLSDKLLQFDASSPKHDHGEFKSFPPDILKAGEKGSFITKNSGPVTGTEGELRYRLDDQGTTWMIRWNNPRAGDNTAATQIDGPNKALFDPPAALPGQGGEANFRYTLKLKGGVIPPEPKPTPGPGPVGPDAASSCHVMITNNTKDTLTLGGQGHERGDFMTFPANTLAPGASTNFVSVETPNAKDANDEGCKGFVLWQVGSSDVLWRVEWDNPEGSKNVASASFNPSNTKLTSLNQIGQGEENVPTAFTLTGESGGGGVTPPVGKNAKLPVHVVEKGTDRSLESVEVTVGNSFNTTRADGLTTIEVAPGKYTYKAVLKGFETATGPVEVIDGTNNELLIVLSKGEKREGLSILVRDKGTGIGIQGAQVKVGDQTDTTGSTGISTVELPAGNHAYQATTEGYEAVSGKVDVFEGDNPELVIDLSKGDQPRQGLTVVVVDKKTHKPIQGAAVSAGDESDISSANGLTTFELPVGKQDWKISADGYKLKSGSVEVIDGDNPELIVELEKDGTGSKTKVSYLVTDESGDPIEGAAVSAGADQTDTTDKNGFASVEVEAGNVPFMVEKEGFKSVEDTVDIEEGSNEIVPVILKKDNTGTTKVTFLVTDKSGDPIAGAAVSVGADQTDTTDANGNVAFEVEAGNVPFMVEKEGFKSSEDTVDVEEGANEIVPVVLEKGEEVEFTPPPESKQPTLKKGATSDDGWVEYLQKLLNQYLGPNTVDVNGKFDEKTFSAVKKFQGSTTPPCLTDGIVGNETWSMLRKGEREKVGSNIQGDEKGQEARWATEKNDFVAYVDTEDKIFMLAVSVGDTPLDPKTPITVRMSKADGSGQEIFKVELGNNGADGVISVEIPKVVSRFGTGALPVEAYFQKDLGGDLWSGKVDTTGGGKGGGDGKPGDVTYTITDSKTGKPIDTASVTVGEDTLDGHSDGVFLDVSAGKQPYKVTAKGYKSKSGNIEVTSEKETKLAVKLDPSGPVPPPQKTKVGSIGFLVTDKETGTIVSGASVTVDGKSKITDAKGSAEFDDVKVGEYSYEVIHSLYEIGTGELTVLAETITLEDVALEPTPAGAAHYEFKVEDGNSGKPVAGASVTLAGFTKIADRSGRAIFTEALTPGSYDYTVVADGYEEFSNGVVINEGDNFEIPVLLNPSAKNNTGKRLCYKPAKNTPLKQEAPDGEMLPTMVQLMPQNVTKTCSQICVSTRVVTTGASYEVVTPAEISGSMVEDFFRETSISFDWKDLIPGKAIGVILDMLESKETISPEMHGESESNNGHPVKYTLLYSMVD